MRARLRVLMRVSDAGFRFPGSLTEETDEFIPLWNLNLHAPMTPR